MPQVYYYHGKLLLSGEYLVLDGAVALAIPTKLGQRFTVTAHSSPNRYDLTWSVAGVDATQPASSHSFHARDWQAPPLTGQSTRDRLLQLFHAAEQLRPACTHALIGKRVDCYLEFPADWGLGSSSTLISFLAEFLKVDPYALLAATFGGSGYDLACATAVGPTLYERRPSGPPRVTPLTWRPDWLQQTYFVHRNRKQNSREGIRAYRSAEVDPRTIEAVNELTGLLQSAPHLRAAARLLERHELLVGNMLDLDPVGRTHFTDFPGTVKSLGAWGGDFVWVLSERPAAWVEQYFTERGYTTFLTFENMAL